MSKKKLTFWIEETVANRVRKRAIAEGRTLSEAGAAIVENGLSVNEPDSSSFDLSALEKLLDRKFSGLKNLPVSDQKPAQASVHKPQKKNRPVDSHVMQMVAMTYQICVEVSKKIGDEHEARMKRSESFFERVLQKYPDSFDSAFDEIVFSLSTKTLSLIKGISAEINKNDVQNHARLIEKSTAFFKGIQQKLGLPEEE
jgi:hypothetical protein